MTTEPVPVWPGEFVGLPDVGNVFVRSAPALSGNAQPAVFVHGLGGASTNWTDLMDVLRRPAAGGSKPDLPALHGEALDLPGFGYSPVPESSLQDRDLVAPNRALAAYARWHERLDAFIVLRARDPRYVLEWRVQAEEAMKARGLPGLDRAAIEDYIRRFLPAYATYGGAPAHIPQDRRLTIWLDQERRATEGLGPGR